MKYAKHRKPSPQRLKRSFAQMLAMMPNVGRDEDFYRSDDVLRAWDEMIPVGREFGAENAKSTKEG